MTEKTIEPDLEGSFRAKPTSSMGRPWGTVLWAMLLFAMGVIAGGSYHRIVHPHRLPHSSTVSPVPHFAQRLRKDLRLSEQQAQSIESIVVKYEPRFRRVSQDSRSELLSELQQMNAEIVPLLNEQQRAQHEIHWNKMLDH